LEFIKFLNIKEDKVLTANDFKMKMNDLNAYRKNINDDIKPYFNQMRKTLIDLCDEHTKKKLVSSLKSSSEYRVKFQKDPIKYDNNGQPPSKRPNIISNKILESISHEDKSSSENSDISVPNAVESNDDDTGNMIRFQLCTASINKSTVIIFIRTN
jgi:hypothetical protein